MGTCITSEKKTKNYEPSIQLKLVHVPNSASEGNLSTIKKKSSSNSDRLAEKKAKLQPLKKGVQQRKRIIQKSFKQYSQGSNNKQNGRQMSKILKEQIEILQIKINKNLKKSRSEIFKQTIASISTNDNHTISDVRSSNNEQKCSKCQSQINRCQYAKIVIDNKQHNLCHDCATNLIEPLKQNNCVLIKTQ